MKKYLFFFGGTILIIVIGIIGMQMLETPIVGQGWPSIPARVRIDGRDINSWVYRSPEKTIVLSSPITSYPLGNYFVNLRFHRAGYFMASSFFFRPDRAIVSESRLWMHLFDVNPGEAVGKQFNPHIHSSGDKISFTGFRGETVEILFLSGNTFD